MIRCQPHTDRRHRNWKPITRTPRTSVPKIQTVSWSQVWPIPFPYTLRSPFHQNANRSDSTPDHQRARHSTCSHSQPLNINVQSSLEHILDKQFFECESKHKSRPEYPPSPPSLTNGHQVLILRPTPKYTSDERFSNMDQNMNLAQNICHPHTRWIPCHSICVHNVPHYTSYFHTTHHNPTQFHHTFLHTPTHLHISPHSSLRLLTTPPHIPTHSYTFWHNSTQLLVTLQCISAHFCKTLQNSALFHIFPHFSILFHTFLHFPAKLCKTPDNSGQLLTTPPHIPTLSIYLHTTPTTPHNPSQLYISLHFPTDLIKKTTHLPKILHTSQSPNFCIELYEKLWTSKKPSQSVSTKCLGNFIKLMIQWPTGHMSEPRIGRRIRTRTRSSVQTKNRNPGTTHKTQQTIGTGHLGNFVKSTAHISHITGKTTEDALSVG